MPSVLRALAALTLVTAVACGGAIASDPSVDPDPIHPGKGTPAPTPTPTTTATTSPAPTPVPESSPTWVSTAQGCGNFEIYFPDTTNQKYIVVNASKEQLGLEMIGDTVTIDLASATGVSLQLDTYDLPAVNPPYCNDFVVSEPTGTSLSTLGTVTFTLSGMNNGFYQVDVKLQGVYVTDPKAENGIFVPDLTFTDITVGWFAG